MGKKELKELFDDGKNKYYVFILNLHMAWLPMMLIWGLFDWIFSPNLDSWPKIVVDLIVVVFFAYFLTAISFGILGLLFTYLGIVTRKDFSVYVTFFVINIIYLVVTNSRMNIWPVSQTNLLYGPLIFWLMILITCFMNRFNRMSEKINEIHEKLNNNR
jgi:hypothetical protein